MLIADSRIAKPTSPHLARLTSTAWKEHENVNIWRPTWGETRREARRALVENNTLGRGEANVEKDVCHHFV